MWIVALSTPFIFKFPITSFKYAFVAFGSESASVNNIGADTSVPFIVLVLVAANGDAASPSTNAFPFTNTILAVPAVATASVNPAYSFAIVTAVSYLLSHASISTLASLAANQS